jgi:hypothetical protein
MSFHKNSLAELLYADPMEAAIPSVSQAAMVCVACEKEIADPLLRVMLAANTELAAPRPATPSNAVYRIPRFDFFSLR